MTKPIKVLPPTYCVHCKANSIDIFDAYNKPIDYFKILATSSNKEEVLLKLNSYKNISFMGCKRCMTVYKIDWSDGLPKPLRNQLILNRISNGKIF